MSHTVQIYRNSGNLGDAIQTVALCRLLRGPFQGVYRGKRFAACHDVVINGWLGSPLPINGCDAIYAGIHIDFSKCQTVGWLRSSIGKIGARDPSTQAELLRRGIPSDLVGCATMALPRYGGKRLGRISVDSDWESGCNVYSNKLPPRTSWLEQWQLAIDRLEIIKQAEVVFTNRLHIALPCLALGTPVAVTKDFRHDPRFSIWNSLGLPYMEVVTADLKSPGHHFIRWLEGQLGQVIEPTQPSYPVPANMLKIMDKKIVVGILSECNHSTQRALCRSAWATSNDEVEVLFLTGQNIRGTTEVIGDVLELACSDENQTEKVKMFCRWAVENRNFNALFLCHDQTYVSLDRLQQLQVQADYIGRSNRGLYAHGGPGYVLSMKAAAFVGKKLKSSEVAEDRAVGELLRDNGIQLAESKLFGRPPCRGPVPAPGNSLISSYPVDAEMMHRIAAELNGSEIKKQIGKNHHAETTEGPNQEFHLEIVSHCWQYSALLTYQLSSLVTNPPQCKITMTVFYSDADEDTKRVLSYFSSIKVNNVSWNWCKLPSERLFRRSIGRNIAALRTSADWIWFIDCDYVFGLGFIDKLSKALSLCTSNLTFPNEVIRVPEAVAQRLIENTHLQACGIQEIPSCDFIVQRFTRAIGGIQIVRGDVARVHGYCKNNERMQKPQRRWTRTIDDVHFRRSLGNKGTALAVPGLIRIAHSAKGRTDPGAKN